jgi:hypothetical protein
MSESKTSEKRLFRRPGVQTWDEAPARNIRRALGVRITEALTEALTTSHFAAGGQEWRVSRREWVGPSGSALGIHGALVIPGRRLHPGMNRQRRRENGFHSPCFHPFGSPCELDPALIL